MQKKGFFLDIYWKPNIFCTLFEVQGDLISIW